jgi:hypothetical protein
LDRGSGGKQQDQIIIITAAYTLSRLFITMAGWLAIEQTA